MYLFIKGCSKTLQHQIKYKKNTAPAAPTFPSPHPQHQRKAKKKKKSYTYLTYLKYPNKIIPDTN